MAPPWPPGDRPSAHMSTLPTGMWLTGESTSVTLQPDRPSRERCASWGIGKLVQLCGLECVLSAVGPGFVLSGGFLVGSMTCSAEHVVE